MLKQLIGQTLDRYRITSSLGEGGMGAVYKAHDITLQRDVAIKVMHSHLVRQPDFQERFLQEARTIARLDHSSIVKVYDFGEAQRLLYLVMEFIPGDNLRQMLRDLRISKKWIVLPEAVQLIHQISLALDYAHHQKVLHRDIKPDNIMLKDKPSNGLSYQPVVTDLGLAKLLKGGLTSEAGMVVGTPAYMSPEQAWGRKTDARSDVYSLGILLYELVVGKLPFLVSTIDEAKHYHLRETPPAPRSIQPDLPESLEQIILKALEKDPASRFPKASTLAEALAETVPAATRVPTPASMVSLKTQYQQSIVKARGASIWEEFPEVPVDLGQDRISILAPDGTVSSVPFPTQGLTIGRAADSDLVLNYPNVSKQHARVEFDGTNYRVSDLGSTNGTYLGDAKLLPGVSKEWTTDKALRIGKSWLRLERASSPTRSAFIPSTGTLIDPTRIDTSPGLGWVGVYVETFQLAITPGSEATVPVIVLNQGPETDRFEVSVTGEVTNWVTISPSVIQLPSGTEREVTLTIQPPRSPQSRAGRHNLKIRVVSQNDPGQLTEVTRTLTIAAYSQFKSNLQSQKVDAGQPNRLSVENQGNAQETFNLQWQNQANDLVFKAPEKRLQVPAGQAVTTEFQASPRQRRWVGGTKVHLFSIQVSSPAGEAQTHDGEVVSRGFVPAWFPPVLFFLCAALAAVGAFGYYGVIRTQQSQAVGTAQAAATKTAISEMSVASPTGIAAVDTNAAVTAQVATATAEAVENANQATHEAVTATANWLGQDDDRDGLTNSQELELGTLPNKRDTDEDGLDDGDELNRGTDPLKPDTDDDGLKDGDEVSQGIDPLNRDTDGDGTPDAGDPDPGRPPTPIPPTATPSDTPTPQPQCLVNIDAVNLREGPSTQFKSIDQMSEGTSFEGMGRNANATWISGIGPRTSGWVSAAFLACTYDLSQLPVIGSPPTYTPTPTHTPTPEPLPDLFISELALDPSTPTQGSPVSVRVGVYNQGTGRAGAFTVQWWAGENYSAPACTWRVESLDARGGKILTCTYDGYPSWYGSITTKAEADSEREVAESDEENSTERMTISVARPSTFRVVFDSYPNGTPITTDRILEGNEFLASGIRLAGAPESSYCADATVAAIRRPGTYSGITFYFLTSASPGEINRCNGIPVAIIFTSPIRHVTLTFAGASVTYTMKAYDSGGRLLGTVQEDAVLNAGTFEVTFSSGSSNISRVTFGRQTAVTAIKEIYYER